MGCGEMPAYDKTIIQALLAATDQATTRDAQGKALEDLARYLFGQVPGISITDEILSMRSRPRRSTSPFGTSKTRRASSPSIR